jgi:NAD(P)H dehydrogenase (quinone)
MITKVYVVFYSMYSHVYQLAEAIAEGVRGVEQTEVSLFQVSELMSDEMLEKSGAKEAKESFSHIPIISPEQLGVTSTGTQHGGQETTITSFHTTLLHHGMVIVGVPYSEQRLMNMDEITGGTPYGASTLAGADGSRQPTENELEIARFQGRHVAEIAEKLKS